MVFSSSLSMVSGIAPDPLEHTLGATASGILGGSFASPVTSDFSVVHLPVGSGGMVDASPTGQLPTPVATGITTLPDNTKTTGHPSDSGVIRGAQRIPVTHPQPRSYSWPSGTHVAGDTLDLTQLNGGSVAPQTSNFVHAMISYYTNPDNFQTMSQWLADVDRLLDRATRDQVLAAMSDMQKSLPP